MTDDTHSGAARPVQVERVQPGVMPFFLDGLALQAITRGGEPWFVLADVCRMLEIGNPSDAARRLDDDEKHTLDTVEGVKIKDLGVVGAMPTVISESGLYALIITSRKPAAKRFKKWVTSEVIPAIRRTGSYGVPADPMAVLADPAAMRGLLLSYTEKVLSLEAERAILAPKADALDRIASADGSFCITDGAKLLQVRPKVLFDYLSRHGWVYRRAGADHWCAYQQRIVSGDLVHKVNTVLRPDGSEKTTEQVRVTAQGVTKLAKLIGTGLRLVPASGGEAA